MRFSDIDSEASKFIFDPFLISNEIQGQAEFLFVFF